MLIVGKRDRISPISGDDASRAAGFAVMTIAAAALVGWWAELPLLTSWGSGFAAMKPVTALCLLALGLALARTGRDSRFACAVGLAVAALAALDLGQGLFDLELGIDRWLAPPDATLAPEANSFRMADAAALAIVLAGGSLALSGFERRRAAIVLGSLAGVIAAFALLGYATGIDALYDPALSLVALPTAVSLLCVAGAIVLRAGAIPLRKPRPLWHLLVMLGFAIVVPFVLFGAYTGIRVADAQLDQVRQDLMSEARTLSGEVNREIIGEIERLQALAASPSLREGDFAAFQHQAEASLTLRQSGNITLVDRNLDELANTWVPAGTPLPRTAAPEATGKAFATGRPQITGLFMGPATRQLKFAIILPVQIDGENRYAIARSPDQDALERLVAGHKLPEGWRAAISDGAHRIVAQSERQEAFLGRELPRAQQNAMRPGVFEFIDPDGRPSLQASVRSELTGWQTVVWAPKSLLEAPVRALWWTVGVLALLAFALVVALALALGRIIARSVSHTARAATALGEGGPLLLSETPIAEVNTLIAELRKSAAKRQAAEQSLRNSERQLRLVTDNAPVAIAYCDTEARYKFVNRQYAERLGLTPEQVAGKRIPEVVGEHAYATFEQHILACLAGQAVEFEAEIPYRGGPPQFMHSSYQPEWKDGKVVGLVAAIVNISDRRRAEMALRMSEQRLRLAQEAAGLGAWEYDFVTGRSVWSDQFRALVGLTPETPASLASLLSRIHPDDRGRVKAGMTRACQPLSDRVYHVEFRVVLRDSTIRWLEDQGLVEADAAGAPLRAFGVARNITARKDAEEARARLAAIVTSSADAIFSTTLDGTVTSWNAGAERMFGYASSEMVGQSVRKLIPPDRQAEQDMIPDRLANGERIEHYETVRLAKNGRAIDVSLTISPMHDAEGRITGASKIARDITDRKLAEQDLQAGKERLQLALSAAQLGWWRYDPLRRMASWDARLKEIYEIAGDEMHLEEVMKRVHPDDAERVWAAIEAALDPADPGPHAIEYRVQRGDGEVRWIEAHGLTHFEGAGAARRAVSVVGTVADITERKQREEQVHLLMREINHRAKNMLSVVQAIAHQTAAKNPEDFVGRFSERIQALSANQDLLVRNEWKGVEIDDLVRTQLSHFADLVGRRIAVHGPRLRLNAASAQAVGLALHELATNAGKYGALSTAAGCVDIGWYVDGKTLTISWAERGGPPVYAPKRRGFGSIVTAAMVERSVDGHVHLDYAPSGLIWRLTCPVANALERQRGRGDRELRTAL